MIREINKGNSRFKFRAWDIKNKYMDGELFLNLDGGIFDRPRISYDTPHTEIERQDKDNFILMQYTGLKDKNGVEIYEGDIVRFYFDADSWPQYSLEPNDEYTEMIDTVRFEEGCFYFFNRDVGRSAFAYRHCKHCEVIGNIYEHKHLLEEK